MWSLGGVQQEVFVEFLDHAVPLVCEHSTWLLSVLGAGKRQIIIHKGRARIITESSLTKGKIMVIFWRKRLGCTLSIDECLQLA